MYEKDSYSLRHIAKNQSQHLELNSGLFCSMGEKRIEEKEEEAMKSKTSLVFAINGERFELELSSIDPSTTLVDFLRNKTPFKSVKLGCGEGMMITIVKVEVSIFMFLCSFLSPSL